MRAKARPRLYFSFRSPFSWMALHLLEQRLPQAREIVDFVPYWDPDAVSTAALQKRDSGVHYTQMTKAKHLYILQDTKRLAAQHGLAMAWPIDVDPWWERPHLAWLQARHLGADKVFYDALTAARWERGENICDPAVLGRVAASVGIDGRQLVSAVDDPAIREEATTALARAYDDDVFGIPYFRIGRHRFWGIDRLDAFLDALLPTIGPDPAETPHSTGLTGVPAPVLSRVGGYDHDTAGGCG